MPSLDPIIVTAEDMHVVTTAWNSTGAVLAVAGVDSSTGRDLSIVQFFSLRGEVGVVLEEWVWLERRCIVGKECTVC